MPFPGRVFASGSAISGRVLRPSYSVNASSFNCLLHRPTSISCAWCRTSTELRTAPVFGGCRLEIEPGTVASSESRNLKRIRSDGSRCCTFGTEGASDGLRRPLAGWRQGRLACSALTRGQAPLVFPPLCRRYISVGRTASCEKEEEPSSGIFTSTSITWSARKDGYSDEQPEKSPVQQLSPSDAVAVATNSLPSPDVSEIEEEEDTVRDPDQIVSALDKYIVGQTEAKKSLAIALRDRWRRQQVKDAKLRKEIVPNNLLLIGPSGCGKTELAKRLAAFAGAPFVKVAATRFTEVGFVGDDTSSIVHYLAQQAYADEKERMKRIVRAEATTRAISEVARLLREQGSMTDSAEVLTAMIKDGRLDEMEVEVDDYLLHKAPDTAQDPLSALFSSITRGRGGVGRPAPSPFHDVFSSFGLPNSPSAGSGGRGGKWGKGGALPGLAFSIPVGVVGGHRGESVKRKVTVKKAVDAMLEHFVHEMTDTEEVQERARQAAENSGIVFLDEFDKLVEEKAGDSTSAFRSKRVGVQRELLTLIEGTSVSTQIGVIHTDHVLFIASGAFVSCKPSDIIPELQGRLPIRCDLKPLTEQDFVSILKETEYNLLEQQTALLSTEGVKLTFEEAAVREIARIAHHLNSMNANVGARRLKTVLAKVLEEIKFSAHKQKDTEVVVTKELVEERLRPLMAQADLCKYIL